MLLCLMIEIFVVTFAPSLYLLILTTDYEFQELSAFQLDIQAGISAASIGSSDAATLSQFATKL
jgi:hypothetical protein